MIRGSFPFANVALLVFAASATAACGSTPTAAAIVRRRSVKTLGMLDRVLRRVVGRVGPRCAAVRLVAVLGLAAGVDACGGTVSDSSGSQARVPRVHRAAAAPCDTTRPPSPGLESPNPGAMCTSDAECTSGLNGRCTGNGHDGWRCTYDECTKDADCVEPGTGKGGLCACENGFHSDNNVCLFVGNCRIDADCGSGGYCSPTLGDCGNYSPFDAYYCHTAADECVDDADCGGAGAYCAYSAIKGHWSCSSMNCVG